MVFNVGDLYYYSYTGEYRRILKVTDTAMIYVRFGAESKYVSNPKDHYVEFYSPEWEHIFPIFKESRKL